MEIRSIKLVLLMGLTLGGGYALCELRARENVKSSAGLKEAKAIKPVAVKSRHGKKNRMRTPRKSRILKKKKIKKEKERKKKKKKQKKAVARIHVQKVSKSTNKSIKAVKGVVAPATLPMTKLVAVKSRHGKKNRTRTPKKSRILKKKKIKKEKKRKKARQNATAIRVHVQKADKKTKKSIKVGKKLAPPATLPTIKPAGKKDVTLDLGAEQAKPTTHPSVKKKVQKIPDIKGSSCKHGSIIKSDKKTVTCTCQLSQREATCTIAQGSDVCDPCAGVPAAPRVYLPDRLSNCKNCKSDENDLDLTCECDTYHGGREAFTLKDYKQAYKKCPPNTHWLVTYHPKHANTLMCAHFEKIASTDSVDGCDRGTVKYQRVTFVDGTVNITGTQCHCPHDKDRMCYTVELGKSKCSPCPGWYSTNLDKPGCQKGTVQSYKNPPNGLSVDDVPTSGTQCKCIDHDTSHTRASDWWGCGPPWDCTPTCPILMKVADKPGCKPGTVKQYRGRFITNVEWTTCMCQDDEPGAGLRSCDGDCIPKECGKFAWLPAPNDFKGCKPKTTQYLKNKGGEIYYAKCTCSVNNQERHMNVNPPVKQCTVTDCSPGCPQWLPDDPDKQYNYGQCKSGTVEIYIDPMSLRKVQKRRCMCKDTGKEVTCDGDCSPNCPTWLLTPKNLPRCQKGTVARIGGDKPQTSCFCAIDDGYGSARRVCDGLDCIPQCKGNTNALNEFCDDSDKINGCYWVCADKKEYNDYYQKCKKAGGVITGDKCCYYDETKMECKDTGKYYHCVGKHDPSLGQLGDYCPADDIHHGSPHCDHQYICRKSGDDDEYRCGNRCTSNDDCKTPYYKKNGWIICNWATSTSHRRYGACSKPKGKGDACYASSECAGKLVCRQKNGDQCNSYKPADEGGCDGTCVKAADFGGACKKDSDCRYTNEIGCIHGKCRYKCKKNSDCKKDGTVPATSGWTTCHWDMKDSTGKYGHCASPRAKGDKCWGASACGNNATCVGNVNYCVGSACSSQSQECSGPDGNCVTGGYTVGKCVSVKESGESCRTNAECKSDNCVIYQYPIYGPPHGQCCSDKKCSSNSDCSGSESRCLYYKKIGCCVKPGQEGVSCTPGTCADGLTCVYASDKTYSKCTDRGKCLGVCVPNKDLENMCVAW